MPTNKRESLIFTIIMCFCMVLWMSVYNVARVHGWDFGTATLADAWLGFPPAYVVAMLLDVLLASRFAKWFAFRFLVTPGKSSRLAVTLAISTMMVFPMVLFMSLYGALEAFAHVGDPAMILPTWIASIPWRARSRAGSSAARSLRGRCSRSRSARKRAPAALPADRATDGTPRHRARGPPAWPHRIVCRERRLGACARHTPARITTTPSHSTTPSGSPSTTMAMNNPAGSSAAAMTVERPAGRCGDPRPKSSTGHMRPKKPATAAKGRMPWKTTPR